MAEGSKSFTSNEAVAPIGRSAASSVSTGERAFGIWGEILLVFLLMEIVFWTPRSPLHTMVIAALVASAVWFGLRGRTRQELGFRWPSRAGTATILAIGCTVAVAIPVFTLLGGHPLPASPEWPKFRNLWPYVIWALAQQFLLQSYFFVRFETLFGARRAVLVSALLFSMLHLPNWPLTALTLAGGLFFTQMFRTYCSLYPLGIVHAAMGIAIAYSFPDSLMHHMRVGLSYWRF
jgi:hypothetical protein